MKKYLWPASYSLLLILFTLYVALDTFVIPRSYSVIPETMVTEPTEQNDAAGQDTSLAPNQSDSGENENSNTTDEKTAVITDASYSDENIRISITAYREYDSTIYVADIALASASYLQTALAENTYGKNITEKTSSIADSCQAILAINGDYYGAQEKGYVLRNGVIYRSSVSNNQEDLVIYEDGSFGIIQESSVSAEELLESDAFQILSFGPALLEDGKISITEDEEVGKAKTSNPRTAIAIVDDLHYLFIVSDGRTDESEGLSLYELAHFIQTLGAQTAYNLDGGGSSTMYFNGQIINNPTTNGKKIKERSVSDIVYIGY